MAYSDDDESIVEAEVHFYFYFYFYFVIIVSTLDFTDLLKLLPFVFSSLLVLLQEDGALPDREQVILQS